MLADHSDSPTAPVRGPRIHLFRWLMVLALGTALLQGMLARPHAEALPLHPKIYEDGHHTFFATQPGDPTTPVSYDPCTPLVVTLNPAGGPPEGEEVLRSAMRTVAQVTGLTLRWGGTSGHRPADLLEYGPIEVTFTDETEVEDMTSDIAGLGGSRVVATSGQRQWYSTGRIMLSSDYFTLLGERGDRATMLRVVLHEFGHVLGLGHVSQVDEIMAESGSQALTYGHGDLSGLAILGTQPCRG